MNLGIALEGMGEDLIRMGAWLLVAGILFAVTYPLVSAKIG